uniref:USP domain-containing protein n=1 Tax=Phytophthora ramorum TaxID=164328 RepID=H3HAY0_PHYRM
MIPGCTKGARSRGLCKRHGGGKRCTYSECTRSDQGGGFCIAHGGGKRCATEGCKNSAQSRGLCKSHGEVTRDDGEIDRSTLQTELVLRKEVGNARLVSGDAMLWVDKGVLTHKDSTLDSAPTRTVRVENGKRRFVFTVALDAVAKQFYAELKDQVDGKAGVEIRKKKRKIRKQLNQSPLKSPSTLLKSPAKKPPMTPKRSPLADIGTPQQMPQLTLPPPLPVTTKGPSSSLASPLRSPFRSPFRKKARLSLSPSSAGKIAGESNTPSLRSPSREWLSPARSLKLRSGPTPPDLKRHSSHTPENQSTGVAGGSGGSSSEMNRRKSITRSINKRVRSLQLMLDDEPAVKCSEAEEQRKITSHFFKKSQLKGPCADTTARELDMSMESAADELGQDDDASSGTASVKAKSLEQLRTIYDTWRTSGDTKHLPLQYTLSQLLQLVIKGSETSINPEPLKNVMGKKNAMFATHFQQDAHEFLLNLVTEYEKELVETIELETLIQKQFETEVLELTCEKCKVGKEAASAYQVKSLPSVLVFHLKRFEVNPHSGALFKRCDPVVPPAVIDPIRSINNTASSGNEGRYALKSVIHHLGKSIDEGHYVADVCNGEGQWIRRNDTHESLMSC